MENKEFKLIEKRKEIIEKILKLFHVDFNEPINNAKQLYEKTDLIGCILRFVEEQDKEFIKLLKEELSYGCVHCLDAKKRIDKLSGDLK